MPWWGGGPRGRVALCRIYAASELSGVTAVGWVSPPLAVSLALSAGLEAELWGGPCQRRGTLLC